MNLRKLFAWVVFGVPLGASVYWVCWSWWTFCPAFAHHGDSAIDTYPGAALGVFVSSGFLLRSAPGLVAKLYGWAREPWSTEDTPKTF